MKLVALLILTISLNVTIVSSIKCKNQNATCIELCCNIWQSDVKVFKQCQYIAEFNKHLWFGLIRNMAKIKHVNFIEYGECSQTKSSKQLVIDKCFSPYYDIEAKNYILKEYSNVPCDRVSMVSKHPILTLGFAILLLTPLFLPILLLYSCTKKDKTDNISYKLITWYLMSIIATLFTMGLRLYIEETLQSQDFPLNYLILIPEFFSTSTFLWLSCIGYNAYARFKEATVQSTKGKDLRRFTWFSAYVWGGTLTLIIVDKMIENTILVTDVPMYFIAFFNVFAFVVLGIKMCLIHCSVISISTKRHIKCKLALIICRLCILMGIPRMLLVILEPFIGSTPMTIMLFLEPYMLYGTFIAENKNCCTLFRCKWCCPESENGNKKSLTKKTVIGKTTTV